MMYSSPGQPLPGTGGPYGAPPPPGGGTGGPYGAPPPPGGGTGGPYGAPPPPGGGTGGPYGAPPPPGGGTGGPYRAPLPPGGGTGGPYGTPPPPGGGTGGPYGAPPPPSGVTGGPYRPPLPPSGGQYTVPSGGSQPGYHSSHQPPTQEMAGMAIQRGNMAPPGGSFHQPPISGGPPQQNFGPPPPSTTAPGQGPTNFGQGSSMPPPPGGSSHPPHSTAQLNFHPPPTSNFSQTGFGQVPVPGQTGFGPSPTFRQTSGGGPPTSGHAPMGPEQSSGQVPPTSGQAPPLGYGPPRQTSQPGTPEGYGLSKQPGQPSGQPPPTSGHAPLMGYGPQTSGQALGHPPTNSGQAPPTGYGSQMSSGQALPTSGQPPPLGYGPPQTSGQPLGHPPPPTSSGAPLSGHPLTAGQLPPVGSNHPLTSGQPPLMGSAPHQSFGQPFGQPPPPSGQLGYSQTQLGQPGPSPGMYRPPPHSSSGQVMQHPPGHGLGMNTTAPPPQMTGVPPLGAGGMPPRGPGMMLPPGNPGGPMGGAMAPRGGLVQQPRTRIDPDQMPNPVAMMKLDQDQRGPTPFYTSVRGVPPPLVTTNFTVIDDGNSSPRYLRATMYHVPCSRDLINNCRIPLGLVVQPLATVPDRENTLHLVDHGTGGPLRCNRCKTYMNPFVRFVDGGRQYICPICQCSSEVPQEYFSHLDHKGMRTDIASRPELTYGSVEYKATVDYCKDGRLPKAPAYIFMLDVSAGSVNTGLLPLLSQSILTVLDHLPDANEEGGSPILVGLATYDKVLHFYNLNSSLAQPGMMVVTDTADVFVPIVDGFLVNAKKARAVMESLLSQLPEVFSGVRPSEVVLEPAVRAGLEALKAAQRNGRLFVFHSSLPTAQGPGQLKNRLDSKLLGTDKEKVLFQPVNSPYTKLGEECVKHGVAVEMFLAPTSYCDVATLGGLCNTTGGQLHLFHNYKTATDGSRLVSELTHCVARHTGFDAVMRVRASTGLRPTGFYGAFLMQNTTDIELGNIDTDKAIAVEIKHDDKLKEEEIAFFQAALLYTTFRGERRLRIHNIALNCTTKFQDLYRSSEIDTIINYFSKSLMHASLSLPYKTIRDSFTKQCATILACYRKQCSSQSPAGQLILPESLKLLPMYANCILKSDCLLSPPIVSMDEKCWLMYSVLSMPLEQSGAFFYPRMISLHDVDVEEKGLPPIQRCTGQKLQDTGVYVIENGFQLVVWVGQQVSHDFISQMFGAPSPAQINTDMASLPALDNPLSFRVRGICSQLQETRRLQMKVKVVKQRDKSEVFFRRLLKEDKGAGQWEGTSYIDFLCQIHRDIKEILN